MCYTLYCLCELLYLTNLNFRLIFGKMGTFCWVLVPSKGCFSVKFGVKVQRVVAMAMVKA